MKIMFAALAALTLSVAAHADHHEGKGEAKKAEMMEKRDAHKAEMKEKHAEHKAEMMEKRKAHKAEMMEKRKAHKEKMKGMRQKGKAQTEQAVDAVTAPAAAPAAK